MTYLEAHSSFANRRRRISRSLFVVCGIVVILFAAIQFYAPYALPGLFASIARPFWRMQFSVSSGSLQSPQALEAENESLKLQLATVEAQSASASAIESENEELLGLLGRADIASDTAAFSTSFMMTDPASSTAFASPTLFLPLSQIRPSPFTLAAVLERPPVVPYDELIIDAGRDHGFSTTSLVYAPGGILIGRVSEALSQTSKVTLLSSPGQQYPVLIGSAHLPATAIGRGEGQYQAELPVGVSVAAGDAIFAPSLNDMPFGVVSAVVDDPAQPFQQIVFVSPVNVFQLRWVLVKK